MSKKIVWSDFLKEEAIFRYWYVLENNNFKSAIKNAQKEGKMNYGIMHNALYSGLYYGKKPYLYGEKTAALIKSNRQIEKNSALANFMDRHEILQNIHAMSESARSIRINKEYGYNAKLFANEFYLIAKQEEQLAKKAKIKTLKLINSPSRQEQNIPNQPNRYSLARRLVADSQNKKFIPVFKTQTKEQKQGKFQKALKKYTTSKQGFDYEVLKLKQLSPAKSKLAYEFLNEGLYRTVLPHYGHDIDKVISTAGKDANKFLTAKELLLHSKKFDEAIKVLAKNPSLSTLKIYELLRECGIKTRHAFIKKERNYPECNIGFLNAFCEMISHRIETTAALKNQEFDKPTLVVADKLIDTILKLKNQYSQGANRNDKEEAEEQIEKFRKALESSNEHNI